VPSSASEMEVVYLKQ